MRAPKPGHPRRMRSSLVTLPILALTMLGCGDDGPTTAAEDTETSSTGDGDGDSTGDGDGEPGDGDGDPTGDGDGDGPIENTSLEVHADGQRIGYLMDIEDYSIRVWDDVNGLMFSINTATGHVAGAGQDLRYESTDCTGDALIFAPNPATSCDGVPAPLARRAWGDGVDGSGFSESQAVLTTTGDPMLVQELGSRLGPDGCEETPNNMSDFCVLVVTTALAIPTTFPTPIEIVESTP